MGSRNRKKSKTDNVHTPRHRASILPNDDSEQNHPPALNLPMVILPTLFSSSSPLLHRYPAAAARRMPPAVFHPDSYALCEPGMVFNLERCLRMHIGAHKGCDPWKALAYAKSNADYKRLISLPRRDIAPENAMRLGRCSTSAVGPLLPPPPAFAADTAAFGATTVRRRGGPARRTREKEKSTGWAAWAFESRRMHVLHVTCTLHRVTTPSALAPAAKQPRQTRA